MNIIPWLHLGHVLGAIAWVGGGFALLVLGLRARRGPDPAAVTAFGAILAYVGPRVLAPGVGAVIVFGVAMVLIDGAWDFGQVWVLLAIGLFIAAFLIGALYLGRIGIRLGRHEDGLADDERRRLVDRWIGGYALVLVILLVAIWDMVFKPGL
ncbi:MAG: DUF2269 family protein [Candidatus Limnocylindria bacterium]